MSKGLLTFAERNVTKASLQRQRTAWSSGVGHERVSKDELNKRYSMVCRVVNVVVGVIVTIMIGRISTMIHDVKARHL